MYVSIATVHVLSALQPLRDVAQQAVRAHQLPLRITHRRQGYGGGEDIPRSGPQVCFQLKARYLRLHLQSVELVVISRGVFLGQVQAERLAHQKVRAYPEQMRCSAVGLADDALCVGYQVAIRGKVKQFLVSSAFRLQLKAGCG